MKVYVPKTTRRRGVHTTPIKIKAPPMMHDMAPILPKPLKQSAPKFGPSKSAKGYF